jgi:transcriptional regulator with XRE-family HTH domain
MSIKALAITGGQIRAARALTRIDQADLALRAGTSLETIKRLERIAGEVNANASTLSAIMRSFHDLGVALEMTDDGFEGVRWLDAAARASPTASKVR